MRSQQAVRSIFWGMGIALLSLAMIIGSFSLGLLEGMLPASFQPGQVIPTNTVFPSISFFPTTTVQPLVLPDITIPPTSAACPPPAGWIPVVVQASDTLDSLSRLYNVPIDMIALANCLGSYSIKTGSVLYLPPSPTSTSIPCGPPAGWVIYIIKSQDTLFSISILYQTTVPQLQTANCLGSSTVIFPGQRLYVPNVPVATPSLSPTPMATFPTTTSTATGTSTPTSTSTATSTPTATATSTPTPTPTP